MYSRVEVKVVKIPCILSNYTSTSITCNIYIPGLHEEDQEVIVHVWGAGQSLNPNGITWSWKKEVDEQQRNVGSFYGGQRMRLLGAGFQETLRYVKGLFVDAWKFLRGVSSRA